MKDLLRNAAKADETIIYAENGELARLLWERIGNADIAETCPPIGEEFFYLVGLRKPDKGQLRIDDVVIYRCVAARGYGNRWPSEYPNRVGENSHVSHAFVSSPPWLVIQQQGVGVAPR